MFINGCMKQKSNLKVTACSAAGVTKTKLNDTIKKF